MKKAGIRGQLQEPEDSSIVLVIRYKAGKATKYELINTIAECSDAITSVGEARND